MTKRSEGTRRITRRLGIVAAIAVLAGSLAACSAGADSSQDTAAEAKQDGSVGYGADAPAASAAAMPAAEGGQSHAERSVIVTGSLYMTVEDPMKAAASAQTIVEKAGGRIDARSETAPDEHSGGAANLTLRVPTKDLDAVVDELRVLGTVDSYNTSALDVSAQVIDLDARISTLRASTERIERLLDDAKDIPDIITLENELSMRQAELESLEAQQRGLKDQVSLSTIDLSLTTEPIVVVESDDSPSNFWEGLGAGWGGLLGFLSGALVVIGVLLPWVTLLAIVVSAIVIPIRRAAKRRDRAQAPLVTGSPGPELRVPGGNGA